MLSGLSNSSDFICISHEELRDTSTYNYPLSIDSGKKYMDWRGVYEFSCRPMLSSGSPIWFDNQVFAYVYGIRGSYPSAQRKVPSYLEGGQVEAAIRKREERFTWDIKKERMFVSMDFIQRVLSPVIPNTPMYVAAGYLVEKAAEEDQGNTIAKICRVMAAIILVVDCLLKIISEPLIGLALKVIWVIDDKEAALLELRHGMNRYAPFQLFAKTVSG